MSAKEFLVHPDNADKTLPEILEAYHKSKVDAISELDNDDWENFIGREIDKDLLNNIKKEVSIIYYEDCCINTDRVIDTFLNILNSKLKE